MGVPEYYKLYLGRNRVEGGVFDGVFGTEDYDGVLRICGTDSGRVLVPGLVPGGEPEAAEVCQLAAPRSDRGTLITELQTDGHHAEGDAEYWVGLHRMSDNPRATFRHEETRAYQVEGDEIGGFVEQVDYERYEDAQNPHPSRFNEDPQNGLCVNEVSLALT
jgi:hypothetical protein